MAIVRAARLYQDALWVAESEPALAWVLFVSAVETAAGHWDIQADSPRTRLQASRPDIEQLLLTKGDDQFVDSVAKLLTDSMGSTRKFRTFLLKFHPDPPSERPHEYYQLLWDEPTLKKAFDVIYRYRSKALHAGTPFPYPMCGPPSNVGRPYNEVPEGLATAAYGGIWTRKDVPMLLHLFEYIVRSALLRWWESMLKPESSF
jgi:hypothetical protein